MNLKSKIINRKLSIGIIGLGYVGLPLAIEFNKQYPTVGFDKNKDRINQLKEGTDKTLELSREELKASKLTYTFKPRNIADVW